MREVWPSRFTVLASVGSGGEKCSVFLTRLNSFQMNMKGAEAIVLFRVVEKWRGYHGR